MIIDRYLQRNVHLGTLGALAVLVSLSLVFVFVRELGDITAGARAQAEGQNRVASRGSNRRRRRR